MSGTLLSPRTLAQGLGHADEGHVRRRGASVKDSAVIDNAARAPRASTFLVLFLHEGSIASASPSVNLDHKNKILKNENTNMNGSFFSQAGLPTAEYSHL